MTSPGRAQCALAHVEGPVAAALAPVARASETAPDLPPVRGRARRPPTRRAANPAQVSLRGERCPVLCAAVEVPPWRGASPQVPGLSMNARVWGRRRTAPAQEEQRVR